MADDDARPQPSVPYMSRELKAGLDLTDSTVTDDFDERSWDMVVSLGLSRQLTTGKTLLELADSGMDDIVVCTADLGRPTQVEAFGRRYPDRYFNFGIAERNMIGAAAGLATVGLLPVVSNYSFFLALMGVENIRNDICYPALPVKMVGTEAGNTTFWNRRSGPRPMDLADLIKSGSTLRTPLMVFSRMAQVQA